VEPPAAIPSLPPVTAEAHAALVDFRQGEIIRKATPRGGQVVGRHRSSPNFIGRFARVFTARFRVTRQVTPFTDPLASMPNGAVVLSQTCDIVQQDRRTVQVAPLVPLSGSMANEAKIRRRPQYVPLPNAPKGLFGDLERIISVHKNDLTDIQHEAGINTRDEERKLAQSIGRRFTRFPFPDNLHPWLRPLEGVLQSKASSTTSPEGVLLENLIEIRVEAKGKWEDPPPYMLTILFVVDPGTLPFGLDEEVPGIPVSLSRWLRDDEGKLRRKPGEIASRLLGSTSDVDKYYLWLALGEAWAEQCHPRTGASQAVMDEVDSIDGEIVSADDLTMDRWWGSEALDLDHLSAPRPL
jgi:hypothetical protein